jgi:hypothetical protein
MTVAMIFVDNLKYRYLKAELHCSKTLDCHQKIIANRKEQLRAWQLHIVPASIKLFFQKKADCWRAQLTYRQTACSWRELAEKLINVWRTHFDQKRIG